MAANRSTGAEADGGGIAVAHGGTGDVRISLGLAVDLAAFEAFAREHDIRKGALDGFLSTVVQGEVPIEDAGAVLAEIAETHLKTRAELNALRPYGETGALYHRTSEALEEGRLGQADALLRELEESAAANAAAARTAALEAERAQARAVALRGNLLLMRLDYSGAAAAFRSAAEMLRADDPAAARYRIDLARAERRAGRFDVAADAVRMVLDGDAGLPPGELALAWAELSQALRDAGTYREAEVAAERALELLAGTADAATRIRIEIERAGLMIDLGRLEEADRALAALEIMAPASGKPGQRTLSRSSHALGRLRIEQGQWRGAEEAITRAIAIGESELPSGHPDLIRARGDLAFTWRHLGRLDEAASLYESASASFAEVLGENHPEYVTMLDHLAGVEVDRNRLGRARDIYERAIQLGGSVLGPDHSDVAQSWNNLAIVHRAAADSKAARQGFQKALDIFTRTLGSDHPDTATARHNLAAAELDLGEVERAAELCASALETRRARLGDRHPAVADSLLQCAAIHLRRGDAAAAIRDLESAIAILRQRFGPAHGRVARALAELAQLRLEVGDASGAVGPAREAVFLARRATSPDPLLIALALNNLGHVAHALGRPRRALRLLQPALELRRSAHHTADHPEVMASLVNLAAVALAAAENELARDLHDEAVRSGERLWPEGHILTAAALNNLAKLMEAADDPAAGRHYARAAEIFERQLGPVHPKTRVVLQNLERWRSQHGGTI